MIALFATSWAIVCGIVKLIAVCFGFTMSTKVATGIWLIILLLSCIFGKSANSK